MEGVGSFHCGDLTIGQEEDSRRISAGKTVTKVASSGIARVFGVTNHTDVSLKVALVKWNTGQLDVRAIGEIMGPMALRRLERGALRMSIMDPDKNVSWVELSQARLKTGSETKHSNLFKATTSELDQGSGLDARSELLSAGALRFGTKEDVLNQDDNRRNYLCVTFVRDNVRVPIVAYIITRVLPLIGEYRAR